MSKKIFKKIACSALAAISVFGCAGTFTACKTSNPEVKMKIEFNGETYTLKYKLYRKIAPKTVEHFLWLAENGYYDGVCIHDYDVDAMYTGAYVATEDKEEGLEYKKYYETILSYDDIDSFPHSVWTDEAKDDPTYTLYGEFWEGNNFKVENGNLKQTFGSLTMYYEDLSSYNAASSNVWIKKKSDGKMAEKEYRYNCATSKFFISMSNIEKSDDTHCTFAKLKNKGELEDFQDDLNEYIEEYYSDENNKFTTERSLEVTVDDVFMSNFHVEKKFDVPKVPIVIKSVKVTKY